MHTEEWTEKASRFLTAMRNRSIWIQVHNIPDPDALASAEAFRVFARQFGISAKIVSHGFPYRRENRALMKESKIKLLPLENVRESGRKKSAWVYMDCVPFGGNVTMHPSAPGHYWMAVDHHVHPDVVSDKLGCSIIEPGVGANATIMAKILLDMNSAISPRLASTLSYAIISDTQDFSRGATQLDIEVYSNLFPYSNQKIISRLRNTPRPRQYFRRVYQSLRNTFFYRNIIWAYIGNIESPEIVAEFADFILSAERITWSLAIGKWDNKLYISLRSSQLNARCDEVIRKLVPNEMGTVGGHDQYAGGLVYVESDLLNEAVENIIEQFVKIILRMPKSDPMPEATPLVG